MISIIFSHTPNNNSLHKKKKSVQKPGVQVVKIVKIYSPIFR